MATDMLGLASYFDGGWIDVGSFLGAVLYLALQFHRAHGVRRFLRRETAVDFVNGLGLFPLLLLSGSALSNKLTAELLTTNKLILSVAGVTALFALLDDRSLPTA